MGAVYRSICNEADTLMLLVTNLAEQEIQLKLNIENLMNDGFVNIAKARYIMGSTCVTKMQLPTENSNPIKPLATVSRKETKNGWLFSVNRNNVVTNNESVQEISENDSESQSEVDSNSKIIINSLNQSEAAFKSILQNDPKSLKKSKNAFLIGDESYNAYNDELLDEISNSGSKESLVSVTDPIRLFGILVPKALKEAQLIFNKVVDLLGECATVQLELRQTIDKYYHITKVKKLIEAASKETKVDVLTPRIYWTPSKSSSTSCIISEEEKGEKEELSEGSQVSIKKSIRSVFFNDEMEPQERDLSIWSSEKSEVESEN